MKHVSFCAAVIAIGLSTTAVPALALPVTWDGEGGNNHWSNALNWNANFVPTAGRDVVIDGAGGANQPVLNVNSDSLNSVSVSGGSLVIDAVLTTNSLNIGELGLVEGRAGDGLSGNLFNRGTYLPNGMTVTGAMTLFGGSFLFGELNGLVVTGTASLDGRLLFDPSGVSFAADYVEAEVLRASSITGNFSTLDVTGSPLPAGYVIGSRIEQGNSRATYLITFRRPIEVPEPSALPLVSFAALAAITATRRPRSRAASR